MPRTVRMLHWACSIEGTVSAVFRVRLLESCWWVSFGVPPWPDLKLLKFSYQVLKWVTWERKRKQMKGLTSREPSNPLQSQGLMLALE